MPYGDLGKTVFCGPPSPMFCISVDSKGTLSGSVDIPGAAATGCFRVACDPDTIRQRSASDLRFLLGLAEAGYFPGIVL
jgi:hypothetical protein